MDEKLYAMLTENVTPCSLVEIYWDLEGMHPSSYQDLYTKSYVEAKTAFLQLSCRILPTFNWKNKQMYLSTLFIYLFNCSCTIPS